MRKIEKRLDRSVKLARVLLDRAATLTLPYDERCKSRLATQLDNGEEVAVLMIRGTVLAAGDVLVAEDGGLVVVAAAPEALMRVTAASPAQLIRAAYHLGNRHTPVELSDGYLQLESDPVLRQMLEGIGMRVTLVNAPFQPEAGAYGGGHRHGHDESFVEDYALAQKVYAEHDHGHSHDHGHGHDHQHGHEHNHSHGHDYQHDQKHGKDHGHSHQGHSHDAHGHNHAHGKDHDHDHQGHKHSHGDDHGHVHGPDCNHDHGHAPVQPVTFTRRKTDQGKPTLAKPAHGEAGHVHDASCGHDHGHDASR